MPTPAGNGKFQVTFMGAESLVVDLKEKTCSCRSFELTGILNVLKIFWTELLMILD